MSAKDVVLLFVFCFFMSDLTTTLPQKSLFAQSTKPQVFDSSFFLLLIKGKKKFWQKVKKLVFSEIFFIYCDLVNNTNYMY